jgi:hypothetical protein
MVAGIFLNAVVIISLWRSSQLRKKLCYFLIFVLSCCDLAAVAIYHLALIFSTILWSMQIYSEEVKRMLMYLCWLLVGWSMLALLTLNVERFFALIKISIFPSNRNHQKETYILSEIFYDYTSRSLDIYIFSD